MASSAKLEPLKYQNNQQKLQNAIKILERCISEEQALQSRSQAKMKEILQQENDRMDACKKLLEQKKELENEVAELKSHGMDPSKLIAKVEEYDNVLVERTEQVLNSWRDFVEISSEHIEKLVNMSNAASSTSELPLNVDSFIRQQILHGNLMNAYMDNLRLMGHVYDPQFTSIREKILKCIKEIKQQYDTWNDAHDLKLPDMEPFVHFLAYIQRQWSSRQSVGGASATDKANSEEESDVSSEQESDVSGEYGDALSTSENSDGGE